MGNIKCLLFAIILLILVVNNALIPSTTFTMTKIFAKCRKLLEHEALRRSSQVLSVVGDQAYVFGGELQPREPRDNHVHVVSLSSKLTHPMIEDKLTAEIPFSDSDSPKITTEPGSSTSPSSRVGTAAASLNGKIYIFSGRGGPAMTSIEEQGGVWEFNPTATNWTLIQPGINSAYPPARSYHCMTSDGKETLYIHAGCLEKGRASDLWAFDLSRREWTELAPAFDPPRGGASIAVMDGKLYRMNGFDGNTEQGGSIDIYFPEENSWSSYAFKPDGEEGPTPRSVSSLLPIWIEDRAFLITMFGERDPSSLGHQGAGKMLSDVWVFDVEKRIWEAVLLDQADSVPPARGWFDADVVDSSTVVVHGGLGESNDRFGDIWVIEISLAS